MMKTRYLRFVLVATVAGFFAGCSAESKRLRLLERAEGYQKAGDLERARIEFQNVLQLQPDDLLANEGLARIWYERGATVRAIAQLSRVVTLAPGNLDARLKRAQLLAALGKTNDAGREALAILGRSSGAAEALVLLTESVRDAQDLNAAEDFLQKFSEKNTVSYHIASANLLSFRGDRVKAKAALERALAIDPKSPAAHTAMAGLHAAMGNSAEALAEHKLAAELTPIRSRTRAQYAGYLAQTGAMTESAAILNDITRQAPDSQLAWRALAQLAILEKKNDDALRFLEKALALDAADYEALVMRARIWQAQGDRQKTIAEYKRIGTNFPGVGLEKHQLGILLLQENDVAGATTALEQAAVMYPDNIEAALLLGQLQLRAGDYQRVASSMAAILSRRSDLVQPYLLLIDATRGLGKLDELVGVFRQNISANPNNALFHHMLGLTYGQQNKPMEMRQSLEKALELAPNFAPAIAELGNLDLQEGKPDAALARARTIIEKQPKLAAGPLLAARAYEVQQKWPEAEVAALDAIRLEQNQEAAYGVLVHAFVARKNEPGIGGKLEAFLAKFPNQLFAVRVAAQTYAEFKDYAKVRDTYEKFLSANPNAPLVLNNLAALYSDQLKQPDRALELARKARALAPQDASIADTLGWILTQRKEYAEALPLLEESAKTLSANGEVQYHVGVANLAMGRKEQALAAFRLVVAAPGEFPGKDDAKRQLAALEAAK